MANVLGELFGDIASAIRSKTGEEGTMKPAEFPEKIDGIAVAQEVLLQEKTVTENGVVEPDEGYDGLGKVTVDVQSSGGGMPSGVYLEQTEEGCPNSYQQTHFELNGVRYALTYSSSSDVNKYSVYAYNKATKRWESKISSWNLGYSALIEKKPVVCNGIVHFVSKTYHVTFDGTTLTKLASGAPQNPVDTRSVFVQDNKVKFYSSADSSVYAYDGTTWAVEKKLANSNYVYYYFYENNDEIYAYTTDYSIGKKLFKYENQELVEVCEYTFYGGTRFMIGKYFYHCESGYNSRLALYRYNIDTGENVFAGYLPNFSSTYLNLYKFDNQLRFIGTGNGASTTFVMNAIMHIIE